MAKFAYIEPEVEAEDSEAILSNSSPTGEPDPENLSLIIILVPLVLAIAIIALVVGGIVIKNRCTSKNRRTDKNKEDLYLDGPSNEKVPMPMFEDDVPSVLELEMEDLEQWMKKEGGDELDSGKM
ncbi:transmembrane protein 154 [Aplochiton taeniatus]